MAKKIFALLLAVAMLLSFAACGEDPTQPTKPSTPTTTPSTPTEPTTAPTQPTEPTEPTEPADPWADYACITIAEALALCEQFVEAPSAERYYIRGVVTKIINEQYGQMIIEDATGSIEIYGSYSADGSIRYSAMDSKPVVGDEVLIHGTLQNYKGNTKEIQNGRIIDFISNGQTQEPVELPADGSELTIAELLALPIADGEVTEQFYIVKATVESISNAAYGAMWITDGTGSISVYNSKAEDGTYYSNMADKPYKGDSVTLKCNVKNFKGTLEINQAYILEFSTPDFDASSYVEMSIADARNTEEGALVKVTGVVAKILYSDGMKPAGIYLVDETNSIYVYDVDLAGRVQEGNKITICASKTWWISSKEMSAAQQFGYKGCSQLAEAYLLENDGKTDNVFDHSWITATTIKELMDTPVTNDITTTIFKVTGLITKDDSQGDWINYYINDLDETTGSYVYTQANGADLDWLEPYNGKVCTIYLSVINAKSSAVGCVWRFQPIEVKDENFDFSTVNFAEFAVKYYGVKQFQTYYSGNPELKLLPTVDSQLMGLSGAALSYVSSDPSIISIDSNTMNCHKTGTAVVTVTGEHNGVTYAEDVTIEVEIAEQEKDYPTVADAIAANVGDTVTVKGIVGPSLSNKPGFYLIDETGVIAVTTDEATLATLELGQQVVLKGVRDKFHNNKGDHFGQSCITSCTVLQNNYGTHDYYTGNFVTGMTLEEIYNQDLSVDYTTTVYVVTATISMTDSQWASWLVVDGNTTINLYHGSTDQYAFLEQFKGQEVTMELALCNWNNKKDWRGAVLAVYLPDGTKVVNQYRFEN